MDCKTKEVWAGKIVSKKLMMKENQRDKMTQEIAIHRSLSHKHIVGFHGFFEDNLNIYIILELCKKRVNIIDILSNNQFYINFSIRPYSQ